MAQPRGDVLVIEDDPEINELVGAYVQLAGFTYRPAVTGQAALDAVRQSVPDVIILDLMLPDLDGLEVCRRIKSHTVSAKIPIIILTALDTKESRGMGKECGAVEYLTKPFDPDRLIRAIGDQAGRQL